MFHCSIGTSGRIKGYGYLILDNTGVLKNLPDIVFKMCHCSSGGGGVVHSFFSGRVPYIVIARANFEY